MIRRGPRGSLAHHMLVGKCPVPWRMGGASEDDGYRASGLDGLQTAGVSLVKSRC